MPYGHPIASGTHYALGPGLMPLQLRMWLPTCMAKSWLNVKLTRRTKTATHSNMPRFMHKITNDKKTKIWIWAGPDDYDDDETSKKRQQRNYHSTNSATTSTTKLSHENNIDINNTSAWKGVFWMFLMTFGRFLHFVLYLCCNWHTHTYIYIYINAHRHWTSSRNMYSSKKRLNGLKLILLARWRRPVQKRTCSTL